MLTTLSTLYLGSEIFLSKYCEMTNCKKSQLELWDIIIGCEGKAQSKEHKCLS